MHPAFPAPSVQERAERQAKLGQIMPRERGGMSCVIASEAKQSIAPHTRKHGLLRRACHLFGEVRRFTAGVDLERVMEIRIRQAERNQAGFEVVDLESLVVDDHPVRAVWCFVEGLDLCLWRCGLLRFARNDGKEIQ